MRILMLIALALSLDGCVSMRCGDDQRCRENAAIYSAMSPATRRQCKQSVGTGWYSDYKECSWALARPDDYACRSAKADDATYKECVWAFNNPVEAKCKREAKEEDYWKCVQITKEADDRQRDRDQRREIHADQMEAERRERNAEVWRGVGNSIRDYSAPKPESKCTTRQTYDGAIETVCH